MTNSFYMEGDNVIVRLSPELATALNKLKDADQIIVDTEETKPLFPLDGADNTEIELRAGLKKFLATEPLPHLKLLGRGLEAAVLHDLAEFTNKGIIPDLKPFAEELKQLSYDVLYEDLGPTPLTSISSLKHPQQPSEGINSQGR